MKPRHLQVVKSPASPDVSTVTAPAAKAFNPGGRYPLDDEITRFLAWAKQEQAHKTHACLKQVSLQPDLALTSQRQTENQHTLGLFKERFNHFLWTGIECSNPETPDGERWDQLQLAGVYHTATRRRQIKLIQELGIENVRLGLPNHKMDQQKSWQSFSTILKDFKAAGLKISLDLQHFGLPSRFRNPSNPEESVYLNPRWPSYFVELAMSAMRRYHPQLDAITLINEPMITNKFSSLLWNEGFPGDYAHPLYYHFFIQRALLIAKAAITARHRIEAYLQSQAEAGRNRSLYIHNESCEYHHNDPEFNTYGRFISSDLILGSDWLLSDAFDETEMGQWMISHYDRPGVKTDTEDLLRQLRALREQHLRFQDTFSKTMRADTVFGVDYYLACESLEHGFTYELPTNLDGYRHAIQQENRQGLARITVDYWNRYQLPILHTETNFADSSADEWGVCQLLELAKVATAGVPVLGFTWYSLMDQYNWDNALKGSPQDTRIYPVGLVSLPDYKLRPFAEKVLPHLLNSLKA